MLKHLHTLLVQINVTASFKKKSLQPSYGTLRDGVPKLATLKKYKTTNLEGVEICLVFV